MDLTSLLTQLREAGVKSFKGQGYEIEFHLALDPPQPAVTPAKSDSTPHPEAAGNGPPDLKGDDLMNFDKVLNWSASPDPQDTAEMPLTGDKPIGEQS